MTTVGNSCAWIPNVSANSEWHAASIARKRKDAPTFFIPLIAAAMTSMPVNTPGTDDDVSKPIAQMPRKDSPH